MESHDHERAEEGFPGEKPAHDAQNPIKIATALPEGVKPLLIETAIAGVQVAVSDARDSAETDQCLAIFKADYDSDLALKEKITWQEIETRLLANNGYYLALAQEMEQEGILFGVDKDGNPLIADRGDEPIFKGMNYHDTLARVLYKHKREDKYDRYGRMQRDEAGQSIPAGYEMFPYVPVQNKSPEITD